MNPFVEKMIRAAKLDIRLFEFPRFDKGSRNYSGVVVDCISGSQYMDAHNHGYCSKAVP